MLLSAENFLTGNIAQSLCWTLVHSLWQGLLVAGVVAVIIFFTKDKSPALRYSLLTGALGIFVAAAIVTFFSQYTTIENLNVAGNNLDVASQMIITKNVVVNNIDATTSSTIISTMAHFFDQYASLIVLCWTLIIAMRCIKLGMGLYGVQQIKKRKISSVGSFWSLRVQQLATKLDIRSQVQFFQSEIVKVPMVIGHLKPVIFFPVGALNALSAEDVEAILLHELAHIRRRDYLVNLLQHFVEILFFFNPAVLWISSLIRTEREHCCDDMALAQTGNKRNYIQALVSFQEFENAEPLYATAFAGKKEQLLHRVKRLVQSGNRSLNGLERTLLIICFLLTGGVAVVFSQTKKEEKKTFAVNLPASANDTPKLKTFKTEDVKEGTMEVYSDGDPLKPRLHYVFKKLGVLYETYGDRTWLKINGKYVPKSEWKKYEKLLDEIMKDFRSHQQVQIKNQQIQDENRKVIDGASKKTDIDAEIANAKLSELDRLNAEKKLNVNPEPATVAVSQPANYAVVNDNITSNAVQTNVNRTTSHAVNVKKETTTDDHMIITGLSYSVNDEISIKQQPKVDIDILTNSMIADLTNENVISSRINLSYKINKDELVVNGVKQPSALHQRLSKKYIQSPDWNLMYNWKTK